MVYRVQHITLDTLHALKVLVTDQEDIHRRLIDEGRVQARLKHPNIVPVSDVLTIEGSPALLMRYIEGPSLKERIKGEPLSYDHALSIFRGIVAGVAHAHENGVIHRDLKPANVLIDAEGVPLVTDFGIAKHLDSTLTSGNDKTRAGKMMGSPAYMAPEQMRHAGGVDYRADIFSLGVILYEMVCSSRPFKGVDIFAIRDAVLAGNYPPPLSLVPTLPQSTINAIDACLKPDRRARASNCATLLAILDGDESVVLTQDDSFTEDVVLDSHTWIDVEEPHDDLGTPSGSGGQSFKLAIGTVLILALIGVVVMMQWLTLPVATPDAPATQSERWLDTRLTTSNWAQKLSGHGLSPDGTTLAYALVEEGVFVRPVEGGLPTLISNGPWRVYGWFPDGERLLVGDSSTSEVLENLYTMALDGTIVDIGLESYLACVSPNGKLLALADKDGLFIVPLDGTEPTLLSLGEKWFMAVAWSPDNEFVAYVRSDDVHGHLKGFLGTISADGRRKTTLLESIDLRGPGGRVGLAWLAPDRLVYHTKKRDEQFSTLWSLDEASQQTDASNAIEIQRRMYEILNHFSGSQHGASMTFIATSNNPDVWLINMDSPAEKPVRITRDSQTEQPRFWLPDGRLVFQANRFGATHQMVVQPGVSAPGMLIDDPSSMLVPCRSRIIAIGQGGEEGIFLQSMTLEGTDPVDLVTLNIPKASQNGPFACHPDGNQLLVPTYRNKQMILQWFNLATGKPTGSSLTLPVRTGWALSPDGTTLFAATRGETPLFIDWNTREERMLELPLKLAQMATWSPDGEHLYITGMHGEESAYVLLEADLEGNIRVIWEEDERWLAYPRISANGQQIALMIWSFAEDIWMTELVDP